VEHLARRYWRVFEKLLAGIRHRLSDFAQHRECSEEMLRTLVTGGPPNLGQGGNPQRMIVSLRAAPALRTTGANRRSYCRAEQIAVQWVVSSGGLPYAVASCRLAGQGVRLERMP
jgi:hypothetical protein